MRDLMGGYQNLLAAMRRAGQRAHVVRYEELVAGDESPWRAVFAYLELDFDPGVLTRFDEVELKGRYGDPTGARRYGSLSEEPVAKWKEVLDGRLRRVWSRRYLRRLLLAR